MGDNLPNQVIEIETILHSPHPTALRNGVDSLSSSFGCGYPISVRDSALRRGLGVQLEVLEWFVRAECGT